MKLILASGSPRRAEILRAAGFAFDVLPANIDESLRPGEAARDYVRRLAEEKANAAADALRESPANSSAIIIAADTTVVAGNEILGKPESPDDARAMLEKLSGRAHDVYTGVALLRLPDRELCLFDAVTRVKFSLLSADEIADYIASGEPFGKAGAYAIQGRAGKFVTGIEGCFLNVMGLPVSQVYSKLRTLGWR